MPEVNDDSGVSLEKKLRQVIKSGGPRDPRLDVAAIPEGFEIVAARFWELYRGERITFSELEAYMRTTGIELSPIEIDAIMAMDGEAASYMGERVAKARGPK
jgi:hypothetical protein